MGMDWAQVCARDQRCGRVLLFFTQLCKASPQIAFKIGCELTLLSGGTDIK